jgi:hypothetical protein
MGVPSGPSWYEPEVATEDDRDDAAREAALAAIAARARGMRQAAPRSLWIAAIIVGVLAAGAFAIALLSRGAPQSQHAPRAVDSGLTGLLVGAAIGLVIGYALGRQRRSHSSRNSP